MTIDSRLSRLEAEADRATPKRTVIWRPDDEPGTPCPEVGPDDFLVVVRRVDESPRRENAL